MQRTDLIRSKKWAMEYAYLLEVGATPRASTSMRHWDESWEISTKNRDRPGGHQTQYMSGWNGWRKSRFAKRRQNKKIRREYNRITAEAVRDFYDDQEYWSLNWHDEFESISHEYDDILYREWLLEQEEYQQMIVDWNDFDMIDDRDHWNDFDKEMEDLYDFMYDY